MMVLNETTMNLAWDERPQDLANLLNPAYMGILLFRAVVGFTKEAEHGMPYPLLFLVPPFLLHQPTQTRLPKSVVTTLPTWLQDHKDVIVEFGKRSSTLVPYTREAIQFLLQHRIIGLDAEGKVTKGEVAPKGVTKYQQTSESIQQSYRRSEFVGKWFARSGSPTTVFALLGVTP